MPNLLPLPHIEGLPAGNRAQAEAILGAPDVTPEHLLAHADTLAVQIEAQEARIATARAQFADASTELSQVTQVFLALRMLRRRLHDLANLLRHAEL